MKIQNSKTTSSSTPPRWPLVGGMGVLIALGIGAIAWLGTSPAESLEDRINRYQERENAISPPDRYADARQRMDDLEKFKDDSDFTMLPAASQEYVNSRIGAYKAYLDYESRLDAIPDPTKNPNDTKLQRIEADLRELAVPDQYIDEWQDSPAVKRCAERVEDAYSLKRAVEATAADYQVLVEAGRRVQEMGNQADLPRRAAEVLTNAKAKTAWKKTDHIQGSERITYETVFRFPSVDRAQKDWNKMEQELRPLAELGKPR